MVGSGSRILEEGCIENFELELFEPGVMGYKLDRSSQRTMRQCKPSREGGFLKTRPIRMLRIHRSNWQTMSVLGAFYFGKYP